MQGKFCIYLVEATDYLYIASYFLISESRLPLQLKVSVGLFIT